MTVLLRVLLGIAILTMGRKLFWLFVGVVGFVVGISLANQYISGESQLVLLVIALAVGVLGALLALFLGRLVVGIAGFIAGGYAVMTLAKLIGLNLSFPFWALFLIGGVVGAILIAAVFDWALIILSSITGASILIDAMGTSQGLAVLVFVVLLAIGIGIQAGIRHGERPKAPPPAPQHPLPPQTI